MKKYYPSIFAISKYEGKGHKGIQTQPSDFEQSFSTKSAARAEARRRITEMKTDNPNYKHLRFTAHVVTKDYDDEDDLYDWRKYASLKF